MAGFDKATLQDKLKALGWTEANNGEPWAMIPPDSLWQSKPAHFDVYQAEALTRILNPNAILDEE